MDLLDGTSIWIVTVLVFALRIVDVSLGTMRTLTIVQGHVAPAVALGFVEILIWTFAISQVVLSLGESPVVALGYAGGFAVGNAAGIALERRLAVGTSAVRFVSTAGAEISRVIAGEGHIVTTIQGTSGEGPTVLVYATCPRRELNRLIQRARAIDPALFYVVERFAEASKLTPIPQPTGWRAVLKKK